jgi:hypothetical protein
MDIEIIIAALPEAPVFAGTPWKTKGQLARALALPFQSSGHSPPAQRVKKTRPYYFRMQETSGGAF